MEFIAQWIQKYFKYYKHILVSKLNKNQIIIIGYSGHSYGCIEIAINTGFSVIGYCDINKKSVNPYGLKYLGNEKDIYINNKVFISIGNNVIRKKVFKKIENSDDFLNLSLKHPNSIISNSSQIKNQTLISAGVIINPQVKINKGCIINTGAIIEHECNIGSFSHIGPGSVLLGNVSIGNNCMIGANSVIKQGVKIGNNVVVGAGSVILDDIHDNLTMVGNPGKPLIK